MDDWEGLDVDDSDLPSLLRPPTILLPCKRGPPHDLHQHQEPKRTVSIPPSHTFSLPSLQPCSQTLSDLRQPPPQNPSPAQRPPNNDAVEDTRDRSYRRIPGPAGSVQAAMHRLTVSVENCAPVRDYGEQEDGDGDGDDDFKLNPWLWAMNFIGLDEKSPLPHSIRTSRSVDRIPQVVGVIKSCRPNGLGDLIVTLKDPTGTIDASIHHKVLAESKFASDISIGSVVVLQQVVAFSPTRSARYLNITLNNVVKIFSKDSGPPPKQRLPACTVTYASSEEHREIGSGIVAVPTVRQETDGMANVEARREDGDVVMVNNERRREGSFCCSRGKAPVPEEPNHDICGRTETKKPISRVSLPDWTDEQLHELFADCDDDTPFSRHLI